MHAASTSGQEKLGGRRTNFAASQLPCPMLASQRMVIFNPGHQASALGDCSHLPAIKDGLELNRGEIIETYNFLALPGSRDPNLQTNLQSARYYNYKAVRDICLGKSKSSDVITMLEAASSCSRQTISASVLLEQIERKRIKIRI